MKLRLPHGYSQRTTSRPPRNRTKQQIRHFTSTYCINITHSWANSTVVTIICSLRLRACESSIVKTPEFAMTPTFVNRGVMV